ncbi:hypothetical protein [Bradyrhizobium sp. USDA 4459]
MLTKICHELLARVDKLPDARSREVISGALRWAAENPHEISYGVGNYDSALQISPNLIAGKAMPTAHASDRRDTPPVDVQIVTAGLLARRS